MFLTPCVCILLISYIPFLLIHTPVVGFPVIGNSMIFCTFPGSLYEAIFITALASVCFRCLVFVKTVLMRFDLMTERSEENITNGIYSILFSYARKAGHDLKSVLLYC
jgi:hypothetical protein